MKKVTLKQIIEGIEGVIIMITCYLTFFLKSLRSRWGLDKNELSRIFPGDDIVKDPDVHFTHAIKINAPVEYVWPWIAQIGRERGGFYSYELLENIAGLDIYNSDVVIPEFQGTKKGDEVGFGPDDTCPIVMSEHGRFMAIENWIDLKTKKPYDPKKKTVKTFIHLSWLWFAEPLTEQTSRFFSRNRVAIVTPSKMPSLMAPLIEPIVFAMDRKMCIGIKKRAESLFAKKQ